RGWPVGCRTCIWSTRRSGPRRCAANHCSCRYACSTLCSAASRKMDQRVVTRSSSPVKRSGTSRCSRTVSAVRELSSAVFWGFRMADRFRSLEHAADQAAPRDASHVEAERVEVAGFRRRLELTHLIDIHTHFMPERVLTKVWAYFEEAGPLVGRRWPIAYRQA